MLHPNLQESFSTGCFWIESPKAQSVFDFMFEILPILFAAKSLSLGQEILWYLKNRFRGGLFGSFTSTCNRTRVRMRCWDSLKYCFSLRHFYLEVFNIVSFLLLYHPGSVWPNIWILKCKRGLYFIQEFRETIYFQTFIAWLMKK